MKSNKSKVSRPQSRSNKGAPVSVSSVVRPSAPAFGKSTNGITMKRREFVGTATNAAVINNFSITDISIATPGYDFNPSCDNLFPWLSNIARCYERFRFNKLKFDFVPSQPTTVAGRYYAAVDYDYDDSTSVTKASFMANMTAVEAPLWESTSLVADPKSLNRDMPYRFVDFTSREAFVEARTMFAGYLMIAIETPTANCLVDIWVDYEVELVTPVLDENLAQLTSINGVTPAANITTASGAAFWGPLNITDVVSNAGPVRALSSGTLFNFSVPISGTTQVLADGLDIRKAIFKGALEIINQFNVTGVTPSAIIGTNQPVTRLAVYGSNGAMLTDDLATAVSAVTRTFGPFAASELATNSKYVKDMLSVPLNILKNYFPTAAVIVPYIYSTVAALGAGNQSFGFRYIE